MSSKIGPAICRPARVDRRDMIGLAVDEDDVMAGADEARRPACRRSRRRPRSGSVRSCPRSFEQRARLRDRDIPDRQHVVVRPLVVAAEIAVAEIVAHRLRATSAACGQGRSSASAASAELTPASRVHGKFSIQEACEATGSISCTLPKVAGAAHQLWNFTAVLRIVGHPFDRPGAAPAGCRHGR